MKQFLWIGQLLLVLPLLGCEPAEPAARASGRVAGADAPITMAPSRCMEKIAEAKLKLPRGFVIRECTTWAAEFMRAEPGLGPRAFGKLSAPSTSISIFFRDPHEGFLEGPIIQAQGEPGFIENAIAANGGPNEIPDVSGLKKAMNKPHSWDVNEGADVFKYYYYKDDHAVFCEGFIRRRLLCGVRGGKYFMTWHYTGRDLKTSLTEMLAFQKANLRGV